MSIKSRNYLKVEILKKLELIKLDCYKSTLIIERLQTLFGIWIQYTKGKKIENIIEMKLEEVKEDAQDCALDGSDNFKKLFILANEIINFLEKKLKADKI